MPTYVAESDEPDDVYDMSRWVEALPTALVVAAGMTVTGCCLSYHQALIQEAANCFDIFFNVGSGYLAQCGDMLPSCEDLINLGLETLHFCRLAE